MSASNSKSFHFEGAKFVLEPPQKIGFGSQFMAEAYSVFFDRVVDSMATPHVDCDQLEPKHLGKDLYQIAKDSGLKLQSPSPKSTNKVREETQIAIQALCDEFPVFVTFIQNCRLKAHIAIKHAEFLIDETCNINNFIKLKRIIGQFNRLNWTREMDTSERQASVSNLGTISETLLNTAFGNLTDNKNFFKVTSGRVNSYGDFVLMCLPNNLWLSVKSNFARERLLASGYSNDILAVGFFEDFKEFTSNVRIRNMQRAGFLCIYSPDIAVTPEQEDSGVNTFQQTIKYYEDRSESLPLNINGSDFFRPLSKIADDLGKMLDEPSLVKRLSVDF